ncbi:MAG TPA: galactose oxidase [Planctomycetota bacterium]|nr:galactose oxidase [Planctomycetota bacterium]
MRQALRAALGTVLFFVVSGVASAHFLWITVETRSAHGTSSARVLVFLNEEPEPGGESMLKFVDGAEAFVGKHALPLKAGTDALEATWSGRLPPMVDASRDMGIRTKGGSSHHLVYTARAQTGLDASSEKALGGLRARLVDRDGKRVVEVTFDSKPVANARIMAYPEEGEPVEMHANEQGLVEVPGLAEGTTGIWANWNDATPGVLGDTTFSETRYYATLTFRAGGVAPVAKESAMSLEPAVTSFGGAVQGDWLYVYGGHLGRMHNYNAETTSKHFRRLNLKDGSTWEELPMTRDLQGVALVSDGRFLYRTGGMSALNATDAKQDTRSIAEFARFDPQSRTWTDLAPMPGPRSTHDSIVAGRTLFVVGGWILKGAGEESEYCDTALAFDLDQPEKGWRTIAQPFERRAIALATANGKLYALGGLDSDDEVQRRVDVYDPQTNAWTVGPELPGADKVEGFAPSACVAGKALFYSGASGYLFRLSDRGDAWIVAGRLNESRISHRLLPGVGNTLIAVGGNNKGELPTRIEILPIDG